MLFFFIYFFPLSLPNMFNSNRLHASLSTLSPPQHRRLSVTLTCVCIPPRLEPVPPPPCVLAPHPPPVSQSKSASSPVSPPAQVQLIRDNTTPASPATPAAPLTPGEAAQSPGEQVQMTWTEKCDGEPAKPPGAATPEGIKDIFNMKP